MRDHAAGAYNERLMFFNTVVVRTMQTKLLAIMKCGLTVMVKIINKNNISSL